MSRFENILESIVAGGDPAELQPPQSRNEVLMQAVHAKITEDESDIAAHAGRLDAADREQDRICDV